MQTFTLYIGSNNATGLLELDRINAMLAPRHQGYTIYTATGHWLGTEEDTAVIIIHDEPAKVHATIDALKTELEQDAIGWQQSPVMQFA